MEQCQANPSYLPRPLPTALAGLADLALDLRWNWNHAADRLWQAVDPQLWDATGNAWLILESVSQKRLTALAGDEKFLAELARLVATKDEHLHGATWFSDTYGEDGLGTVGYFSMEFGLSEALPIYSGGLGILAGDHLKTASDLGLPLVAVGLLYQQGYFRQALDASGEQLAFYPYNDPTLLPAMPLRDADGEWLQVTIELPGRTLYLRGWQIQVGRNRLYLLDSNHPLNAPRDRGITGELYGGNPEIRLLQEMVLGIGGWRLLEALGITCDVCHLNEGHAGFVILERARSLMAREVVPFEVALRATTAGNVFTTHTPVAAAFDRFAPDLIARYLEGYADTLGIGIDRLLSLGRVDDDLREPFNMAYLALRGCLRINGVSRLHGQVSRGIVAPLYPRWPQHEVPVHYVTNGVHMPSWDSAAADDLWTRNCGKKRWLGTLETLEEDFRAIDNETLWCFRRDQRGELVERLRTRLEHQERSRGERFAVELDPNVLIIGFARRFATYKRPDLLLYQPERLVRLLTDPQRPVQLVVAGKAHPSDREGQAMVQKWAQFMRRPEVSGRVVFVEDYDIGLAAELVQGVDLWVNTPRRPWEASGTSGMKVLVNGGLNLSELDGWWAEAYQPELGWALGDGREHDSDPAWDTHEAEQLYALLEKEVIPAFYNRDEHGIPTGWVERVRESMAHLTPQFSTNRMVREYTEHCYLPAAADYRRRVADGAALAQEMEAWREALAHNWPRLHFGRLDIEREGDLHRFEVQVYLDGLEAGAVDIQLYAEPHAEDEQSVWPMERGEPLTGAVNGFLYRARVPADRPAGDYTARVVPHHPEAHTPLEAGFILWQR